MIDALDTQKVNVALNTIRESENSIRNLQEKLK